MGAGKLLSNPMRNSRVFVIAIRTFCIPDRRPEHLILLGSHRVQPPNTDICDSLGTVTLLALLQRDTAHGTSTTTLATKDSQVRFHKGVEARRKSIGPGAH
jgi:hypothetical protein